MPQRGTQPAGNLNTRLPAWSTTYAELSAADRTSPLAPADVERLAIAAWLTGRQTECEDLLARAHHEFLVHGAVERAARCAFWLGFALLNRGEQARGGGWLARAQRLLDDAACDSVERGYLLIPAALRHAYAGEIAAAHELFTQAVGIAERFHDSDLAALARNGQGRTLIRLGDVAGGVALLDEVMAGVDAGEVSSLVLGDVYCSVIEACSETFDVRRAQEWTTAMGRWCETQPDMVPFRGQCLIRRAEINQLRGEWEEALADALQAHVRLSEPPPPLPAVGLAIYQEAELHRLRGDFPAAEQAYQEASRWARAPRPGLALLRLAQGDVPAAATLIRSLLEEARDRPVRARILAAAVEIELAAGDAAAARSAADELAEFATALPTPYLQGLAAQANGAVLLAENEARRALGLLQRAWAAWQELEVPYEAARVRLLIGLACRQLEDEHTARMELEAARWAFERLGAGPDLASLERLLPPPDARPAVPLTPRELEVLRLLADGQTNRTIAQTLCISEKTVERHVSNIFMKLGLSTRAAATAYAFRHELL